ncbi:MAG: SurA N-terminal domain-containing protein [Leptospirales bacterium]
MLELIRRIAVERPKVLGALMIFVGAIFTISMGWWGFSAYQTSKPGVVARINGTPLYATEFSRDYEIMKNNYQRLLNGALGRKILSELNFPGLVLRNMIYRQLWIDEANHLHLVVPDAVVVQEVTRIPFFQEGNPPGFSKNLYTQFLLQTHQSAKEFEQSIRQDLLVQRVQVLVRATQTPASESPNPQSDAPIKQRLAIQEETVQSFQTQLENGASVHVDQKAFKKLSKSLL